LPFRSARLFGLSSATAAGRPASHRSVNQVGSSGTTPIPTSQERPKEGMSTGSAAPKSRLFAERRTRSSVGASSSFASSASTRRGTRPCRLPRRPRSGPLPARERLCPALGAHDPVLSAGSRSACGPLAACRLDGARMSPLGPCAPSSAPSAAIPVAPDGAPHALIAKAGVSGRRTGVSVAVSDQTRQAPTQALDLPLVLLELLSSSLTAHRTRGF
jgi:hypothetical protein